jgi:hypothetical protein
VNRFICTRADEASNAAGTAGAGAPPYAGPREVGRTAPPAGPVVVGRPGQEGAARTGTDPLMEAEAAVVAVVDTRGTRVAVHRHRRRRRHRRHFPAMGRPANAAAAAAHLARTRTAAGPGGAAGVAGKQTVAVAQAAVAACATAPMPPACQGFSPSLTAHGNSARQAPPGLEAPPMARTVLGVDGACGWAAAAAAAAAAGVTARPAQGGAHAILMKALVVAIVVVQGVAWPVACPKLDAFVVRARAGWASPVLNRCVGTRGQTCGRTPTATHTHTHTDLSMWPTGCHARLHMFESCAVSIAISSMGALRHAPTRQSPAG